MARSKHSCRRARCVSVRLPNYAITSNKALEDKNASRRATPLSGRSKCSASIGANPFHHGTEAIRGLRREMFTQTHPLEHFDGIVVQDLPCALDRLHGK